MEQSDRAGAPMEQVGGWEQSKAVEGGGRDKCYLLGGGNIISMGDIVVKPERCVLQK